ncbi:MAG: tetratricopeptide repeat protein [Verrucomicrobiae bacterium]|nr:tetratricopeptide repeat protein [Verrucomicrobiae bacterium]NNJ42170.1 tetratricopeptide repeat protein [Akkermansiaceae bacterium]
MRIIALVFAVTISTCVVSAQDAPLVADPGQDQFEFCKQLYRQANATGDHEGKVMAYQRAIPRLSTYIERFPMHANTAAAMYYLGECYYHSGSLDDAKRVLHGVINRYQKGRYVALASNRLGYDAVAMKKYDQAAVYFGRVATMSTTAQERYRGRYQEASCFRYAGNADRAIQSYQIIEAAKDAPSVYRENAKLKLGHLYLAQKDDEKAMARFEALMLPGVAANLRIEATLNVGLLALRKKEVDKAERCFKAVLLSSEEKFKPSAQTALMNSLYAAKDYQGVLDVMKRGDHQGPPPTEVIKYAIAGRSCYQLKLYHQAIKLFAQAERQLPLSAEAFEASYFRLLCFYNIKGANIPMQVDAFLEIYQKQYPKHERIHKALLMKAETLFDSEKHREAADAYNQIHASAVGEANRANLLFKRGWCLSLSGDHNGAVRSFTDFLSGYAEDERSPRVIARRGKSYLALGDRVSALKDFDLLIERFPKDQLAALAWQNSARIKKEDQDYADMIRRYDAMLNGFPDLRAMTVANANYWIGWGNYQLKKFADVIPALEQCIKLDADKYGFNAGMLIVYSAYSMKDKGRLQSAVDEIQKINKEEKVPSSIYRWLGLQCFNAGEMKGCDRYLTMGTTPLEPRQTPKTIWKLLGRARVETGDYEGALSAIKNFLDVVDQPFWKAESLLDQAEAYLGLDKLEEAQKSAEDGLKLRPKGQVNAGLRMILGDIAYHQKDYAGAAGYYVVVVQIFVGDKKLQPEALLKAYKALLKKGDEKEANHYLDTLKKDFPDYLKGRDAFPSPMNTP